MDEAAWLVRIIPGGDIGREKRQHLARKIIERDSGHRIFRFGRLLFESRDDPIPIGGDAAVFLDGLEIAYVISRQGRLRRLRDAREIVERFTE